MNRALILLAAFSMLIGCEPAPVGTKHIDGVTYELDIPNTRVTLTEYTIDGCQYLGKLDRDGRECYLTHKGNCTNPIHESK